MTFQDHIINLSPVVKGKRHYAKVLNALSQTTPDGRTDFNAALMEYATVCKNPGIAVIISDIFDPKGYQDGLKALTFRNFDLNVVQVLDHEEIAWSQTGTFILRDIETGEVRRTAVDVAIMQQYRQRIETFLADIRGFCENYGMNYYLYDTQTPFEDFLVDYVTKGTVFR